MCSCAGMPAQLRVWRSCAQETRCAGQQVLQRGFCERSYAASRFELALHNHKTSFILLVTQESDLHVKPSAGCLIFPYWYPNADREEYMSQGLKFWFWKLRLCSSPMLGMFIWLTQNFPGTKSIWEEKLLWAAPCLLFSSNEEPNPQAAIL